MPERDAAGWSRVWAAAVPHAVELAAVAEYVTLRRRDGRTAAARAFPSVDAHLVAGCAGCQAAADEVEALLRGDL